jgi:hypothetical protein
MVSLCCLAVAAVAAVVVTLANSGGADGFVVKYSSTGVVQWAARQGGSGSDYAPAVTVDSVGNVIVAGYYGSNPLTVYSKDGSPFGTTLANSGGDDAYIAKYDSAGFVQWVARQGGSGSDQIKSVAADAAGNVIVAGFYTSPTLTFYNKDGSPFITTLASSGYDAYIAKYDSAGFVQWVARQGGSGTELGYSVTVDSAGNIIVVGYYDSNPLTIYSKDGSPFVTTLANSGGIDAYIAKYDSAGFVQWVARQGGSGTDIAQSVTVDSAGNVIVAGYSTSPTLTIYSKDGSPFGTTLANSGGDDAYIAKYDSAGFVQWVARQGGSGNDQANSVTVDSAGNVIVVGQYTALLTVYNKDGSPFGTTLANSGSRDAYIAKYDSAGFVQWVARQGGSGNDLGLGGTVDSEGNVIVMGQYTALLTVYNKDGSPFGTTLANSGTDGFVAKYDSAGFVRWVARQGGSASDQANSVAVDSAGNVIVAGYSTSPTLTFYNA